MTRARPLHRLALIAGLGAVVAGCQAGPAAGVPGAPEARHTPPGTGAAALPIGELVYVTNQDDATITLVDAVTLELVGAVDLQGLGYGANARPHHVAAADDGSRWYVSLIGANRVLELDRANRVTAEAEFEVPGLLALDPGSDRLYVGRSMSAVNPPERIGVVDRSDMSVEEISVFFPRPHAVAAHPHLPLVYSASLAENSLAVVEVEEEAAAVRGIAPPVRGPGVHTLVQWAVSPDGGTLVGSGEMSGRLLVYDLADPREPALVTQVEVGSRPWHPVFSPDGREVWLANKGSNSVTVVDAVSWTVAGVVTGEGLAEPHGAAISADGRYVFISSNNVKGGYPGGAGTLVVIERAARRIVKVIPVGRNATGVAVGGAPGGASNAPR